jgi:hypothetical protein
MSKQKNYGYKEAWEIKSGSDQSEDDKIRPLEDYSNVEYLVDRKALIIKRSLNVQIKENGVE